MAGNNKKHVFIDANVLIDAVEYLHFFDQLDNKAPATNATKALDFLYRKVGLRLYISSVSILQLISHFQKRNRRLSNADIRNSIQSFIEKCTLIDLRENDILAGITLENKDLEDNIQYKLSQKVKCFYIVTNNYKDFKEFANVDIVKPDKVRASII